MRQSNLVDDVAALAHGSQQFKVSLDQLRENYKGSGWAKDNVLIAVCGHIDDGTSGVRDAADATLREEIEKFAHVIFASSPKQRDFWLGWGPLSEEDIRQRYGGLKPCLHGSDAHDHASVGAPAQNRFSWVKGEVRFDTLRQACIDPASRAYVGETPPLGAIPSQVISDVHIGNSPWVETPRLKLNPGLVAIIGPRGSGKTALADIIAAGCDAVAERLNQQSFLSRARPYLAEAWVKLTWMSGSQSPSLSLGSIELEFSDERPRARYLSQQFVENLCSSMGMTDVLLKEIERVVFEAHDASARDGAIDLEELLDLKAMRHRQGREREEQALTALSDRLGTELEKDALVPPLRAQVAETKKLIARYAADREKLVTQGAEERLKRLDVLMKAAEKVRSYVRLFNAREQSLLTIKDEISTLREVSAPEMLRFAGTIRRKRDQVGGVARFHAELCRRC